MFLIAGLLVACLLTVSFDNQRVGNLIGAFTAAFFLFFLSGKAQAGSINCSADNKKTVWALAFQHSDGKLTTYPGASDLPPHISMGTDKAYWERSPEGGIHPCEMYLMYGLVLSAAGELAYQLPGKAPVVIAKPVEFRKLTGGWSNEVAVRMELAQDVEIVSARAKRKLEVNFNSILDFPDHMPIWFSYNWIGELKIKNKTTGELITLRSTEQPKIKGEKASNE